MVDFAELAKKAKAKREAKAGEPAAVIEETLTPEPPVETEKKKVFGGLKNSIKKNKFNLTGKKKAIGNGSTPPDDTIADKVGGSNLASAVEPPTAEIKTPVIDAEEFNFPDQPDAFHQEQVDILKDNIEILNNFIEDKSMITDALKNIMLHVRNHDFLADLLYPEHMGLMVRALRQSYGVVITKKNVRSDKKTKINRDVDDVLAEIGDMEFEV